MPQENKNKKIISDMVVRPKKDPVRKESVLQNRPAKETNLVHFREEDELKKTVSDKQSFFEEKVTINERSEYFSRFRNINRDSVMGERRHFGGCLLWVIAFICIIAIVLGIGGLVAHARVTIIQKQWTGQVDQSVSLAENPGSGQVAFATETQTFTDSVVVPATGVSATSTKANGTVRFYNASNSAKTILAGTIIVSGKNVSYTIQKKIIVPAESKKIPGQVDAAIVATISGPNGNDGLDDFTFASSKTFLNITIHATTPMSGGSLANTEIADPADIAAATATIGQYFQNPASLVTRMTNEIPDSMIVLPIQIAPQNPAIVTDGAQSDGVHVTGNESITILLVSKSDIANALGTNLSVPQSVNAILSSFDGLTVTTATALAANAIPQVLTVHISGTATVVGFVDAKKIQTELAGVSRKQARTILSATPEIQSFTLKLVPFWRHILPTKSGQVAVVVR